MYPFPSGGAVRSFIFDLSAAGVPLRAARTERQGGTGRSDPRSPPLLQDAAVLSVGAGERAAVIVAYTDEAGRGVFDVGR